MQIPLVCMQFPIEHITVFGCTFVPPYAVLMFNALHVEGVVVQCAEEAKAADAGSLLSQGEHIMQILNGSALYHTTKLCSPFGAAYYR